MIEFTLAPYIGALPITFEMLPADVENIAGPPGRIGVDDLGEREEQRGPFTVRYSSLDGKVAEMAFLPAAMLRYQGHDLFRMNDVIGFLSQHDTPFESLGFVVFFELGMTITGYHDEDDYQKAITVFRKGRWDEVRSELVPLGSHRDAR